MDVATASQKFGNSDLQQHWVLTQPEGVAYATPGTQNMTVLAQKT